MEWHRTEDKVRGRFRSPPPSLGIHLSLAFDALYICTCSVCSTCSKKGGLEVCEVPSRSRTLTSRAARPGQLERQGSRDVPLQLPPTAHGPPNLTPCRSRCTTPQSPTNPTSSKKKTKKQASRSSYLTGRPSDISQAATLNPFPLPHPRLRSTGDSSPASRPMRRLW